MPRKITQLAAVSAGDATGFLYALCDDGTVWMLSGGWEKMESIPQDGYDESPAFAMPAPLAEPPALGSDLPRHLRGTLYQVDAEMPAISPVTSVADAVAAVGLLVHSSYGMADALKIARKWNAGERAGLDLEGGAEFYDRGVRKHRFQYVTDLPF
jgi:hypothetical protein